MAAFMAEQAAQLGLKAFLYALTGEAPRTHGLRELLGLAAMKLEELGFPVEAARLREFAASHRIELVELEDAYTMARYGIYLVSGERVGELIGVARGLLRLLREQWLSVMGEASHRLFADVEEGG